jgi:formyltetrahydrofolate-dependent phosphoribosylglycinamide formyltransferase
VSRIRLVVLISGSGSLLQALIDACAQPRFPAELIAVLADHAGVSGLERAKAAGIPAHVVSLSDYGDRGAWDRALRDQLEMLEPDWIVSAGFMRILGPAVLSAFPLRVLNTHPALLPSFPGAHAVRDALAHGVSVTGSTIHLVDEGVDTGPIVSQRAVPVAPDDDQASLHERIKVAEREMLVDVVRQLATRTMHVSGRKVTLT